MLGLLVGLWIDVCLEMLVQPGVSPPQGPLQLVLHPLLHPLRIEVLLAEDQASEARAGHGTRGLVARPVAPAAVLGLKLDHGFEQVFPDLGSRFEAAFGRCVQSEGRVLRVGQVHGAHGIGPEPILLRADQGLPARGDPIAVLFDPQGFEKHEDNRDVIGSRCGMKGQKVQIDDQLLNNYFKKNKDDYIFLEDAFVINMASFNSESSAIRFRNSVINQGWKESAKLISSDTALTNIQTEQTLKRSQLQSKLVNRALDKLFNGEVTLVLKTELNNFVIVQLIDKIPENTIPKYKYIKDNVLISYNYFRKREMVRSFIDSLISQKNIRIY